ncbi:flagellar basal body rod protein FlgC [Pseudohoeflea coraliihabitans]|uniref:Flagellar basal-body rod protein FlgC n=1 Tax=Pseudohoeflea coraliihabitans TaxID=2860393 RepID=A0ABS6WN44_9HYPH|nr:flagellar basal body rod protein FlgC [Pseudohoeflea sp. DP4N28-3]MBW3097373.1 flagellar basal body rod protein FlgC [Pseudohoeflea sp. DP4N28-3]
MDPLTLSSRIASSGLKVQETRLRIISENMANAQSTGETAGADPYRRKTISFAAHLDRATGASLAEIGRVTQDQTDFEVEYDPGHPAADDQGMVKLPNVNMLIELSDMREANRAYEANLQTIKQTRELISMTLDLLRASQ